MLKDYPYNSIYSLFSEVSLTDTKHDSFLSALESEFSYLEYNTVPGSIKILKKKVAQIFGSGNLDGKISKHDLQKCMHFVHMMNVISKGWKQTTGWWHTPFLLDENKPLTPIEDYRHDAVIHSNLVSCREMLNARVDLLQQMYRIEKMIMDFLVYFPRSMYDFHNPGTKMFSGQYEAAVVLTHLIHQLNFERQNDYPQNGVDEFCKQALVNEAIKHANYFVKESEVFDEYDFQVADIDYSKLLDSEHQHYNDNTLIKIVCDQFNHNIRDDDYNKITPLIDVVIFIKNHDRKQPLYNGSTAQAFYELKSEPYVRFGAICFLIKAYRDKLMFTSRKTGSDNKKIHTIKEVMKISRSLSREESFEDKERVLSDYDYSFLKFVAYGISAITTAIEYETPSKEGISEYKKVRRFKWQLIAMLYSTIGNLPLANLKDHLSILTRNLARFIKSSEMMGVLKKNSRSEYLRMKETGEWDKL